MMMMMMMMMMMISLSAAVTQADACVIRLTAGLLN